MMETQDRVKQVRWIDGVAADIVGQAYEWQGEVAAALVEYAMGQPDFEKPSWFDEHDRQLLIERVRQELRR